MHDTIQQRVREPADEPTKQDAEDRDFPACRRRGGQRRDESREADEGRVNDDEEQDGRQQTGDRGAEERVKESVHRVLPVDQVVDRLAVDDDLDDGKG
jgi:hypothetical protein